MKFKLFRTLSLFVILGIQALPVQSQTVFLDIKNLDGSDKKIELSALNKITFSNSDLILNYLVGTNENIVTSSIRKIVFSTSTGINDIQGDHNLFIYPNPSSDFISIKNQPEGETNILIYSIAGTQIMRIQHYPGNEPIDISRLTRGIYIIKVNNKALKFTKL